MPAVSRDSRISQYERDRLSHSSTQRSPTARRRTDSMAFDPFLFVKYPNVDGIREARAEVARKSSSEKRGSANRTSMPHDASRSRQSDSGAYKRRDSHDLATKKRQESEAEDRHRRRPSKHDSKDRTLSKDRRDIGTRTMSGTHSNRIHRDARDDAGRRDHERRPSLHGEGHRSSTRRESVQLPIRR